MRGVRRPERPTADTSDYLHWLSRFSYDEIVEFASSMWVR